MTTATTRQQGGGGTSGLYDVLELILDRGLVIDAFIRVSVLGVEVLKIDIRVVVASVDTYLRFAEACNRLDLESGASRTPGLPDIINGTTGARSTKESAVTGVAKGLSAALTQVREGIESSQKRR